MLVSIIIFFPNLWYILIFFFNQMPLHYACYGGHSNVVEILVKQPNLKVNKKDQNGILKSLKIK